MTLTDYRNPCPICGGTLQYDWLPMFEAWGGLEHHVQTLYRYSCNVCQVTGHDCNTQKGAIESMARKVEAAV